MANAKEKNKKDYKIEISDWLQFLQNTKTTDIHIKAKNQ